MSARVLVDLGRMTVVPAGLEFLPSPDPGYDSYSSLQEHLGLSVQQRRRLFLLIQTLHSLTGIGLVSQ